MNQRENILFEEKYRKLENKVFVNEMNQIDTRE